MNAAARTHLDPIRIGRTWLFADGTRRPVVGGGDGDDTGTPIALPEGDALQAVTDDELQTFEDELVAEFDRLHDSESGDLARMTAIAQDLERVRGESSRRDEQAEADRVEADRLRALVHPAASDAPGDGDEGDDGDEGGDGGGDGDAGGDGAGDAANEDDREPVTAGAGAQAPRRRGPSAAGTTQQSRRPSPRRQSPIVITAAADIPGLSAGATMDLSQVAVGMHEKARALSVDSGVRVPVARFTTPFPEQQMIRESMSAAAMNDVIDAAVAARTWQGNSLAAAGGWCVPSQNMYDLLELDGATGLLQLPTVGVERGGINVPSYIEIDAADGALWSWSEDQDAGTALVMTDIDVATNVATVTFAAPHLLSVGDMFTIEHSTNPDLLGTHTVATAADGTHVTFATVGVADGTNYTGDGLRQKSVFRIPCPTWTDTRLGAYGLTIEHGNLTDRSFPDLTRRYVRLAMNAHQHRMSAVNIAKITSATHSETAVTMSTDLGDGYGQLMSAIELSVQDFRSEHSIAATVPMEVLLPTWLAGEVRANIARRQGTDERTITDQQIVGDIVARGARPQFLEDYQGLWNGTRRTAWPTTVDFTIYPTGTFVEGTSPNIDLGVMRDREQIKVNDFTAAWTEGFSLLARRGPKARKVTLTLGPADGKTGGDAA